MPNLIDSSDIRRLIAGDEPAFRKVYDAHSEQVYQLAFRFLKDMAWSEEIVQEVFLRLWVNRQLLDEAGNMWLYLYVITKRLCLNRLREIRKSNVLLNRLLDNVEQLCYQTEDALAAVDLDRLAQQVIATLPRQQQLIFKLSREDGLSHKEIARQLGISTNTVKNHMVQALKTLKASFRHSDYLYFFLLCCYWGSR